MKCQSCHAENPPGSRFCSHCGTQFHEDKSDASLTETYYSPMLNLEIGSTFADRYQIIEELGRGGMGRVYKALDKEISEKVAIKILKPEISAEKGTIERFRNELRLARKIRHKNVCQMFDITKERNVYFISMEYVSGEDLKTTLHRVGRLSPGKTLLIAKQICKGLAEAHNLGVIHRDLKPHNIMIDRAGDVRIMDFGIARSLKSKGLTESGVMIGTPDYMSPEQALGEEVDRRSDIYSLGVILFELVTGDIPFKGDTAFSVVLKHKSEPPPDPREWNEQLSDDIAELILKCLEKDKKRRFQSVDELLQEIINIEQRQPTTDKVIPEKKKSSAIPRRGLPKFAFPAAVLLLAAILVFVFILWPRGGKALILINTDPTGAEVFLGSKSLGRSPVAKNIAPGSYSLRIEKEGYQPHEESIDVDKEFEKTYTLTAEKAIPDTGGMLDIISRPAGADVYINDELRGKTPFRSEMDSGTYTLRLNYPQFQEIGEEILIKDNELNSKEYELLPFYTLVIPAQPAGARVKIDGKYKGQTPLTIEDWTKGTLQMTIEKDGWTTFEQRITLQPGVNQIDYSLRQSTTPQPKPSPTPKTYRLSITTDPEDAEVFLDNKLAGRTPLELDKPSGSYSVRIRKAGYGIAEDTVVLDASKNKEYTLVKLEKIKIAFKVAPAADVFVDGVALGEVPPVVEWAVEEGRHVIEFSSEIMSKSYRIELDVLSGQNWELRMNMQTGELIQINLTTNERKEQTLVSIK